MKTRQQLTELTKREHLRKITLRQQTDNSGNKETSAEEDNERKEGSTGLEENLKPILYKSIKIANVY